MPQSALLDPDADTGADTATVVDRFLGAVRSGTIGDCDVWAADATLDATVPNWRYRRRGPGEIREVYQDWFSAPGTFEELSRAPVTGGEVVRYMISSTAEGEPYTAHHVHWLEVRDGLIRADVVFCGGRWSPAQQAEMAADGA
jgi:hypothetical protein